MPCASAIACGALVRQVAAALPVRLLAIESERAGRMEIKERGLEVIVIGTSLSFG